MTHYVQGKDGKFAGSIGTGKTKVPTAAPVKGHASFDAADEDVAVDGLYDRYRQHATNTAVARVAQDLHISEEHVRAMLDKWRVADPGDFEDKAAPEERFRYDQLPGVPQDEATQRALRKLGYEHYLTTPYPVFVYGTLRSGQGNERLMAGAKKDVADGVAPGVAIYGSSYGFPYASEHDDIEATTVGEVVWLTDDDRGDTARQMLDHLEGFDSNYPSHSHYERTTRTITYWDEDAGEARETTAWIYLARGRHRDQLDEADRIASGDWVASQYTGGVASGFGRRF